MSYNDGPTHPICFREAADDGRVTPNLDGRGFHYPSCDTLIAVGRWTEPLTCMECGETIPAKTDACPRCGWSWK